MQRGDVVKGDKTFEEHQAQVKSSQGPSAPAKPAPGQPGAVAA
jgi:hypothetical protein